MTTPRRRWFRFAFSLRTLFVLVTACALWLGWQVRIVQERKAVLAEWRRIDKEDFDLLYIDPTTYDDDPEFDYLRIPLVRRLLGDQSCFRMDLPRSMSLEWIERAEAAFPEAQLAVYTPDGELEEFRDSLHAPDRRPNRGTLFKTGLVDPDAADENSP